MSGSCCHYTVPYTPQCCFPLTPSFSVTFLPLFTPLHLFYWWSPSLTYCKLHFPFFYLISPCIYQWSDGFKLPYGCGLTKITINKLVIVHPCEGFMNASEYEWMSKSGCNLSISANHYLSNHLEQFWPFPITNMQTEGTRVVDNQNNDVFDPWKLHLVALQHIMSNKNKPHWKS